MPTVPEIPVSTKLVPKGVTAGPRRPTGGYLTTTKTFAGAAGELVPRGNARPLVAGPKITNTDGKRVTPKQRASHDPALDLKPRTITN